MSSFCSKKNANTHSGWLITKDEYPIQYQSLLLNYRSDALGACRCDFVFYDKKPIIERGTAPKTIAKACSFAFEIIFSLNLK